MTDVPAAAVTAAAEAIHRESCEWDLAECMAEGVHDRAARAALEAAAPHITAAERARACQIAASYLDGSVLREFADEVGGW